jgi:hypothetical protein
MNKIRHIASGFGKSYQAISKIPCVENVRLSLPCFAHFSSRRHHYDLKNGLNLATKFFPFHSQAFLRWLLLLMVFLVLRLLTFSTTSIPPSEEGFVCILRDPVRIMNLRDIKHRIKLVCNRKGCFYEGKAVYTLYFNDYGKVESISPYRIENLTQCQVRCVEQSLPHLRIEQGTCLRMMRLPLTFKCKE